MTNDVEQAVTPWPQAGLEQLGVCPLCGSARRTLLHDGLSDRVFYCAPGVWTSWHCDDCEAAYLDPRPTPASIGMAYSSYFTHQSTPRRARFENGLQTGLQGLVQRFRNGELNRRFGYRREPALRPRQLSSALSYLIPGEVARLDRHIRQLPPPRGSGSRLLDVGAGNGDFVALAQTLGYRAQGLEADMNAVAVGRARGLALEQGSMPGAPLETGAYEQITLNHVIEHLHDPLGALRELHGALAPGGRIWVQTPNLDACGHAEFGRDWLHLDPPRHLVLFNARILHSALERAGFRNIEGMESGPEAKSCYRRSLGVRYGLRTETKPNPHWNGHWKRRARRADRLAKKTPERGESITLIGRR